MFGWNQRLVAALCAAPTFFLIVHTLCQQAACQYASSPVQQSYYHRPDANLEPEEFLARARQNNSNSVMHQYEKMLRQNTMGNQAVQVVTPSARPGMYDDWNQTQQLLHPNAFTRASTPTQPTHQTQPAGYQATPTLQMKPNHFQTQPNQYQTKPNQQTQPSGKQYAQPDFSISDPPKPMTKRSPTSLHSASIRTDAVPQRRLEKQARIKPAQNRSNNPVSRPTHHQRVKELARRANHQSRPERSGSHARIVSYIQDIPSQETTDTADPFAEPPADIIGQGEQENPDNPFADPPPDVLQNQPKDPFNETPAEMQQPNEDPGEPVSQPPQQQEQPDSQPDPFPGIDPFPNTPQSVNPGTEFQGETEQGNPPNAEDEAPGRPPVNGQSIRKPRRGGSRFKTGPYESFNGYVPKPLLPEPPERQFPQYPQQFEQPYYPFGPTDDLLSQPTLVDQGFDTGQLYEGISYDENTELASYECKTCNSQGNRRMPLFGGLRNYFDRLTRIGSYDYQTYETEGSTPVSPDVMANGRLGSRLLNLTSPCGSCGSCNACTSFGFEAAAQPAGMYEFNNGSTNCCCEPMFYFALFGGYSQTKDSDPLTVTPNMLTGVPDGILQFDDGFGVGLALGQWQGRNLRTEVEYSYRRNDIPSIHRSFTIPAQPSQTVDGSINSHAGMFNAVWDFNRWFYRFRPYVGAGVGFAFFDYGITDPTTGESIGDSSGESSFAYQLIAGGSRPCSDNKEWFVEYRFFRADSIRYSVSDFVDNSGFESNNVFFGFRKRF